MKIKINIDLISDDYTIADIEKEGYSKEELTALYKLAFHSLCKEIVTDDKIKYTVNVEVEE